MKTELPRHHLVISERGGRGRRKLEEPTFFSWDMAMLIRDINLPKEVLKVLILLATSAIFSLSEAASAGSLIQGKAFIFCCSWQLIFGISEFNPVLNECRQATYV